MVIDALSVAGERVIVRALSGYPSLAAEAAALLDAASAAGRVGVALMPTPCLAARTRALVGDAPPHSAGFGGNPPATPERTKGTSSGMEASRSEDISCGPHGLGTTDGSTAIDQFSATNRFPAGGERAAIEGMAINGEVATSQFVAAGGSAATTPFAATCEFAAIGESGAGDGFAAGHPPVATGTRAVVGVGRRRAGLEMGVAAAVIVLAGPVAAGARLPRRSMPSARLLAEWSRVLPPGGVVAVLSPPPLGRHRARGGRWEGSPVPGLGEAGLSWTEHIVLVHALPSPHLPGPVRIRSRRAGDISMNTSTQPSHVGLSGTTSPSQSPGPVDQCADACSSAGLSVWPTAQRAAPAQRGQRYPARPHPAPMLPRIAATAITTLTEAGQLVFDPLCGAGTTLIEALHLGRAAVGIDIDPTWASAARDNIAHARRRGIGGYGHVITADAQQLPHALPPDYLEQMRGQVSLLLTSWPAGPPSHSHRGPGGANLTHHQAPRRVAAGMAQILRGALPLMAPDGHVVITGRAWREHGELVDLPATITDALSQAGMVPVQRCVALLAGIRDGGLVTRTSRYQRIMVARARDAGAPRHLPCVEDIIVARPRPCTRTRPTSTARRVSQCLTGNTAGPHKAHGTWQ
jgi:SAM-dependent methyltransferase